MMSARRLSLSFSTDDQNFLRLCLGDEDWASACSGSESPQSAFSCSSVEKVRKYFAMDDDSGEEETSRFNIFDSDSDADDDFVDIERIFSFDIGKLASAVRQGMDTQELSDVIEDLMGEELESRLEATVSTSIEVKPPPPATTDFTPGTTTPSMGGLSGLMTPQIVGDPGEVSPTPSAQEINDRIDEVFGHHAQRRRSSAMQHSRLAEAVNDAAKTHFQDAVSEQTGRRLSAQASHKIRAEMRRHRQSLVMAAEVLEAAGIGVDGSASQVVQAEETCHLSQNLVKVRDAMQVARKRHRQSVAAAVSNVVKMPCQNLPQDKIEALIAKAYAKKGKRQTPGNIVALANARCGVEGMSKYTVHIGPLKQN